MRGALSGGRGYSLAWLSALASFCFLPWYAQEDGFFTFDWMRYFPQDAEVAPALVAGLIHGKRWLLALSGPLLLIGMARNLHGAVRRARWMLVLSLLGLALLLAQGYAIGALGLGEGWLSRLAPGFSGRQFGLGAGGYLCLLSLLVLSGQALAGLGYFKGDAWVAATLVVIASLVLLFVAVPVATVLLLGLEDSSGAPSAAVLLAELLSPRLWSGAGVAWHSLGLAVLTGAGTTLLGLACALAGTRTSLARWPGLRVLSVLPIITPPFVLGLCLILLFGRAGALSVRWAELSGTPAARGLYGLPGVLLAQLLAFTPIAYLMLQGALQALSPALEEAAETLGAKPLFVFRTVTLPMLRPALANAFLVGFIESLADFGNPLVLGGSSFEVLSTEIYFAVAGAESSVPRAAAMTLVLLAFTLTAFWAQRRLLGRAAYTTLGGKGEAGRERRLPRAVAVVAVSATLLFLGFTALLYGVALLGGFIQTLGRGLEPTLAHYADVFAVSLSPSLTFRGGAWRSLASSLLLAAIAAPLTALAGLLTAYLLDRQRFAGRAAFELLTMLSFAVPGTVIGVAYVLAFNAPPFELTGTAAILVLAFVFRNMPVGIRAGLAALSQVDRSLDEASLCLGASAPRTLLKVVLPLVRPALATSMVYGFARAMTAVSAVVFLVGAEHSLATTYILGRVEAGEYGPAIAYASGLIALMALVIALIEALLGRARLGRRSA